MSSRRLRGGEVPLETHSRRGTSRAGSAHPIRAFSKWGQLSSWCPFQNLAGEIHRVVLFRMNPGPSTGRIQILPLENHARYFQCNSIGQCQDWRKQLVAPSFVNGRGTHPGGQRFSESATARSARKENGPIFSRISLHADAVAVRGAWTLSRNAEEVKRRRGS
jgi:hypothetical protein